MNKWNRAILVMLLIMAILLAVPAVLGIVDVWSWTVFDRKVSGLDWTDGRGLAALAMAGASGLLAIIFTEARGR